MILNSQISDILTALNSELGIEGSEKIDIEWFHDLRKVILERGQEAFQDIIKHHPENTQLAWLSTLVIGHLAFILDILFDNEKASEDSRTKINTYSSLLVSIANRCIGLNLLIESGLEAPARVMMRSIYEVCWLIVAITFDDSKYKAFLSSSTDDNLERKIWNRHFAPRELIKNVEEAWAFICKNEGREVNNELNETLDKYRWYTKSSHPSHLHASILSYATYDVEGIYKPSLFGAASIGLKQIQQDLYWLIVETTYILIHLFSYKHDLHLSKSNNLHKQLICLIVMHLCASMNPRAATKASIKLLNVFVKDGIIVS